jgi:hypothetical protein
MRRIESGVVSQADAQLVTRRLRECRSKAARWCAVAAEAAAGVTLTAAIRKNQLLSKWDRIENGRGAPGERLTAEESDFLAREIPLYPDHGAAEREP